jgi:hypothetical protein
MEGEDITKHGWSEYGRLVLKELERLNEGQERLREDLEKRFNDSNTRMTGFNSTQDEVKDLRDWKNKVTEVWSPTQMSQAKDELYRQKNQWQKTMGIIIAVQVILGIILAVIKL